MKVDQLEIGDIFKGDPVVSQTAKVATSTSVREMTNKDKKETAIDSDSSQSSADRDENGRRWSSLDPDRVYRYIVNSGEARLRDLEAKFPEVSGRTLRRLTDQLIRAGRIERVGNPGPASFYRLCHALVPPNGTPAGFATPSI